MKQAQNKGGRPELSKKVVFADISSVRDSIRSIIYVFGHWPVLRGSVRRKSSDNCFGQERYENACVASIWIS